VSRLLLALTFSFALPAMAAAATTTASQPAAPPAPAPASPVTPGYEGQLLRLAEIMGAVHYLAQLCGDPDDTVWRDQMQQLVDTENDDDRARMIDRFNRGYESYKSVYLSCTPAASEANQRYLTEGAKIAQDITARYGR
jgi:uncharacterized protein (TIGR02301 family)